MKKVLPYITYAGFPMLLSDRAYTLMGATKIALSLLPGDSTAAIAVAIAIGPHELTDVVLEATPGLAYPATNRLPEIAAGVHIL